MRKLITKVRSSLVKNRVLVCLVFAVISLSFVVFGITKIANAAAYVNQNASVANGFSVSPVISQLTVEKGHSTILTIYVENPTKIPTIAHPVVNDFVASNDESGSPRLILNPNTPAPANDFQSLVGNLPDISLGPNQQKQISVTITVPNNANSGGYYGAIRFVPEISGQQGNVGLTASVGSLVLVTVPGNLVERLSLLQLSAAQNGHTSGFFTGGNLSVVTRLQNTGNIQVAPYGTVEIANSSGHVVTSYALNNVNPRGLILPDSIRRFTNNLPKNYHWFGHYTITASIGYGDQSSNLIIGRASFWVLPGWVIIGIIILVILVIFAIYWLVRLIKSMRIKKLKIRK